MPRPIPSDAHVQWYGAILHDVDPISRCAVIHGEQPGTLIRIPFDRCNSDIVCLESGSVVTVVRSNIDRFSGYWLTAIRYASVRTHAKPYPDSDLQLIDIGSRRDCYITVSGTDFATYVPKTGTIGQQLSPISLARHCPATPGDDWKPPMPIAQSTPGWVVLATVTWRDPLGRWYEVRVNDFEDFRIPIDHEDPKYDTIDPGDTLLVAGTQNGIRLLCVFVHMCYGPRFSRLYRNDEHQVVLDIGAPTQVTGESFYIDIEQDIRMWQRPLTSMVTFSALDQPLQGVVPEHV